MKLAHKVVPAFRKKVLKPPGAATRRPVQGRTKSAAAARPAGAPLSPGAQAAISAALAAEAAEQFQAPTLRKSTRQRVEEAEKERERAEQVCFAADHPIEPKPQRASSELLAHKNASS